MAMTSDRRRKRSSDEIREEVERKIYTLMLPLLIKKEVQTGFFILQKTYGFILLKKNTRSKEPVRSPAGTAATFTAATPGKKSRSRKLKFLGNFKKLLLGDKRSHSSYESSRDVSESMPMRSDEYLEKVMRRLSTNMLDFAHSYETTPPSSYDRTPPSRTTTATTSR
jgi:hypothetical protein